MARTVQQVAARVGLPARTVRYYDRVGLVAAAQRSEAGYRLYTAEDEGRLRFVKQARSLGFSLDEVRQLLAAAEAGCCGELLPELDRLLDAKLVDLDETIAELREFRQRRPPTAKGAAAPAAVPATAPSAAASTTPPNSSKSRQRKEATRVCEFCGCSEPVVDVKRDPDELRRELEERRRDEIDREPHELELETVEA